MGNGAVEDKEAYHGPIWRLLHPNLEQSLKNFEESKQSSIEEYKSDSERLSKSSLPQDVVSDMKTILGMELFLAVFMLVVNVIAPHIGSIVFFNEIDYYSLFGFLLFGILFNMFYYIRKLNLLEAYFRSLHVWERESVEGESAK